MSVIMDALAKLDKAVGNLDGAIQGFEENVAGQQRDMFGAASNENEDDSEGHTIDGAVIAQRLDQAIEKVETILNGVEKEQAHG